MIREKFYIDQTINFLEIFNLIISVTILLEVTVFEFYPIESLKVNAFVLWPIVSIFASLSVYSYINQKYFFYSFRINDYFFKTVEDICEQNDVINYL